MRGVGHPYNQYNLTLLTRVSGPRFDERTRSSHRELAMCLKGPLEKLMMGKLNYGEDFDALVTSILWEPKGYDCPLFSYTP